MEIVFVAKPQSDVIAWERQFGKSEGAFTLEADGAVVYRHPVDAKSWCISNSVELFLVCAEAWNSYTAEVRQRSELEQVACVARLRSALERVDALEGPDSYWSVLLEQAEQGQL
jgi:hypothetical protein